MAKICLPKNIAAGFKQGLKSGQINPDKLSNMTSKERNEFFKGLVGEEYATMTNSLFESKLLLKNQKAGMITWAKTVAGLKPETRRDLLTKIEKLDNILTPENADNFLNDLVNTKLGVSVTDVEASDIARLAREATDAKAKMESGPRRSPGGEPTAAEIEYGLKTVELNDYVNDLKIKAESPTIKELLFSSRGIKELAGTAKSLVSALDNSAVGRQGLKVLFNNPRVYSKLLKENVNDVIKTFAGKDMKKVLNAEIISDPRYDMMKKAGLAVGTIEEAFPTSLPERIPGLGTLYKASDTAYSNFLHRARYEMFKRQLSVAESQGVNINDVTELKGIANFINSLTGRGGFGKFEGSLVNTANVTLFSPRLLKSHIDTLTHPFGIDLAGQTITPFARKQAALSLLKISAGVASIMAVAESLWPDSTEKDPRSSNFGKIKIGNTRFDIAGGNAGIVTLAARMAATISNTVLDTKYSTFKNSVTGESKAYNQGKYGESTGKDAFIDFFTNKASPPFSVFLQVLEDKNFDGEKPENMELLKNLYMPIYIQNIKEMKKATEANFVMILLADFFGIGTQTY